MIFVFGEFEVLIWPDGFCGTKDKHLVAFVFEATLEGLNNKYNSIDRRPICVGKQSDTHLIDYTIVATDSRMIQTYKCVRNLVAIEALCNQRCMFLHILVVRCIVCKTLDLFCKRLLTRHHC